MRTVLSGPVDRGVLERAELIAGIEPSGFVTNGATPDLGLPVTVFKVDPLLGELGPSARNYTLCQQADALVVVGRNEHLVKVACQYGLPVHQE